VPKSQVLRGVAVACVLALIAGTSCAINPATGKRQLSLIGEGDESAMGKQYDAETLKEMSLYGSPDLQAYVQDLGKKLAAHSERPELAWTFRLVDDPTVNAFALPGGYIYITRGLMAHMGSEAELAGVVGHEIGHVTARHSVNQMSKQQLFSLGLGVGVVLSDTVAQLGQALSQGLQVMFLKFSRDDEREADQLGLRYLYRSGYDPRPMTEVYETLGAVSSLDTNERLPDWMATHPNPEDRRQRISQAIATLGPDFSGRTVARDEYLHRLDGMVYGEDPRQGYFDGVAFLHPALAFRFDGPAGWKGRNLRDVVVLQSPENDAALQLTLSDKTTPEGAAEAFFARQGVTRGPVGRSEIHGLPAVVGTFALASDGQQITGQAAFIQQTGRVYQLVGFATSQAWPARKQALEGTIRSFRPLTDPEALAAKPYTIEIEANDRAQTLAEFDKRHPSTIPIERLAVLNHAKPDTRLEPGRLVKRVVGGPGKH